jgi:hypothetical protein
MTEREGGDDKIVLYALKLLPMPYKQSPDATRRPSAGDSGRRESPGIRAIIFELHLLKYHYNTQNSRHVPLNSFTIPQIHCLAPRCTVGGVLVGIPVLEGLADDGDEGTVLDGHAA